MKLILHTNAPWAGSGYGVQTKHFAPRLTAAGHSTAVSAFYGLQGGALDWGDVKVYPAGHAPYGTDVGVAHARHFGAECVVALMDAWVLGPMVTDCKANGVKLIMWSPIDQGPVTPLVKDVALQADAFFAYSKWGTEQALEAGIEHARYVPLAVDTHAMHPIPKAEARKRVGLPDDKWIVGMVAANKCPYARKAWAQALEAFAAFVKTHPDAHLYLHTEITPAHGGWDIGRIIIDHGIQKHVTVVDRYLYHLGLDADHMASVFSAMDVLLSPSLGEGFGVPIIEAQACGTPVIIGDWTSMPELFGAGTIIGKEDAERTRTLQGGYWYTPHVPAITTALNEVYAGSYSAVAAREKACEYDADTVTTDILIPALAEFLEAPIPEPKPVETFEYAGAA